MQLVCLLEDVPIVELQMHVFLSTNLGGKIFSLHFAQTLTTS
jgi:hypothetical protein